MSVRGDGLAQPVGELQRANPGTRSGDERLVVQFRAEIFNLTNSPFFEARNQTTDVTNQDFGRIISGSNPRNIQFGVRILF